MPQRLLVAWLRQEQRLLTAHWLLTVHWLLAPHRQTARWLLAPHRQTAQWLLVARARRRNYSLISMTVRLIAPLLTKLNHACHGGSCPGTTPGGTTAPETDGSNVPESQVVELLGQMQIQQMIHLLATLPPDSTTPGSTAAPEAVVVMSLIPKWWRSDADTTDDSSPATLLRLTWHYHPSKPKWRHTANSRYHGWVHLAVWLNLTQILARVKTTNGTGSVTDGRNSSTNTGTVPRVRAAHWRVRSKWGLFAQILDSLQSNNNNFKTNVAAIKTVN